MAQESMEIASESDCEIFSEDSEDEYNLQTTVAVTETDGDEIADALSEIHSEKSFFSNKQTQEWGTQRGIQLVVVKHEVWWVFKFHLFS